VDGWPQADTGMLTAGCWALADLASLGLVDSHSRAAAIHALLGIPTPQTPYCCSAWLAAVGASVQSKTNGATMAQSVIAKVMEATEGTIGREGWEKFTCEACCALNSMGGLMNLMGSETKISLRALILKVRRRNEPLVQATAQMEALLHLC
jgi:hypothetical protein